MSEHFSESDHRHPTVWRFNLGEVGMSMREFVGFLSCLLHKKYLIHNILIVYKLPLQEEDASNEADLHRVHAAARVQAGQEERR